MIATSALAAEMERFLRSGDAVFVFRGCNLHPDGDGLLATPGYEHRTWSQVDASGSYEVEPYTWDEPRVFPRRFARYRDDFIQCERLATPFRARLQADVPLYVHVKFCRRDPLRNWSADARAAFARAQLLKVPLPAALAGEVRRLVAR
jgi:hypothetical protein